ncbi:hypothetical protein HDU83_001534 [Entophlyctis luteolus]|nr:hypothetical protein HDU83_001534 [Entophlyctis luteolus]
MAMRSGADGPAYDPTIPHIVLECMGDEFVFFPRTPAPADGGSDGSLPVIFPLLPDEQRATLRANLSVLIQELKFAFDLGGGAGGAGNFGGGGAEGFASPNVDGRDGTSHDAGGNEDIAAAGGVGEAGENAASQDGGNDASEVVLDMPQLGLSISESCLHISDLSLEKLYALYKASSFLATQVSEQGSTSFQKYSPFEPFRISLRIQNDAAKAKLLELYSLLEKGSSVYQFNFLANAFVETAAANDTTGDTTYNTDDDGLFVDPGDFGSAETGNEGNPERTDYEQLIPEGGVAHHFESENFEDEIHEETDIPGEWLNAQEADYDESNFNNGVLDTENAESIEELTTGAMQDEIIEGEYYGESEGQFDQSGSGDTTVNESTYASDVVEQVDIEEVAVNEGSIDFDHADPASNNTQLDPSSDVIGEYEYANLQSSEVFNVDAPNDLSNDETYAPLESADTNWEDESLAIQTVLPTSYTSNPDQPPEEIQRGFSSDVGSEAAFENNGYEITANDYIEESSNENVEGFDSLDSENETAGITSIGNLHSTADSQVASKRKENKYLVVFSEQTLI